MNNNPYEVLGIPHGASEETVRDAYRELVRKYHPDQFTDSRAKELAEAKMREINAAYDAITLGNQQQTSHSAWSRQQAPNQPPPYGSPYSNPNPSPYYRSGCGGDSCCQTLTCLCCADSCCECMGGDLCLCC
ncbi:MAG TPA: J domain-containing protein [Bacillota bacterium]|jgi:curved DNA-binding protein CbpA|nr:J domain-containing protein [Fastidiosipila sp.]HPX92825.1 J domain-containing protein [Bacillota bacterium]HQB81310.1 J domain-containing protein [Bacillota bacterium]